MSDLPVKMIRYLIAFRVNAPMVWFHLFPPIEFSLALGTIISESLPSAQAESWKKSLEPWKPLGGIFLLKNRSLKRPPQAAWPIESVLFCYPGKRAYGQGELIPVEIKLMGTAADHVFFLEVILPGLETASRAIDRRWQRPDSFWGRFDIKDIYVARGHNWESLVHDCHLDLKYVATPFQWSEGLDLYSGSSEGFSSLKWTMPFDFRENGGSTTLPTLKDILLAFRRRVNALGAGDAGTQMLENLEQESKASFEQVLETCSEVPLIRQGLYPVLESQPGYWAGKQTFESIPKLALPYLMLASMFHVGLHTHFGCGTFLVE